MKNENRGKGRPKGRATTPKMTKAQSAVFTREATNLILTEHMSYSQFVEWCAEVYNFSKPNADAHWRRIWDTIKEKFQLERDNLVSKHLDRYWEIHQKALENNDLSTARQTLNDIAKLQGLNEPEKLDINQNTTIEFKFGDES